MDLLGTYGVGRWREAWDGDALTQQAHIAGFDTALAALHVDETTD